MKKFLLFVAIFVSLLNGFSQLTTYDWPTGDGQALLSDKYKVFVKHGTDPEVELEVLMSHARYKGDYRANYLQGRTFSFAQVAYDETTGQGLTFRVVKNFGATATSVAIAPKSYGIAQTVSSNGLEVSFQVNKNTQYISVNFKVSDNSLSVDQNVWIKHMLCIFVNPPETQVPLDTDSGTVVYSPSVPAATLEAASTLIFRGYHNLQDYQNPGTFISAKGKITLKKNQKMYMAGGSFIEGNIETSGDNVKIYGHGILSLRQYIWPSSPDYDGYDAGYIIHLNNNSVVQGIMVMEPCWHGIVGSSNNLIENIKFLGWHCNNDGVRVGSGSEIRNSFMRAVDDFFYDFGINVHNMVLWQGHNGSIMTYGWGSYNSGASKMDNIDIINPEWTGLGNNNGLIMSQTQFDYKPYDYGTGSTTTILKNIRIEGKIPGLTNIKTRENGETPKVPTAKVGYLGDLILENISVESQFDRGVIRGKVDVATDGLVTYYTQNISMKEITIGGVCVTEANKGQFFTIDPSTTRNLVFKGCNTTGMNLKFVSPIEGDKIIVGDNMNVTLDATDSDGSITSVSLYKNNELVATKTAAPYVWEGYDLLNNMQIGDYVLKAVSTDNQQNKWEEEIKVSVVSFPNVENLTINVKSTSSLFLEWDDKIDREKGFIIERAKAGSTDFVKIATLNANDTTYLDENLESFVLYQYRMRTIYETATTQASPVTLGRTIIEEHATLPNGWTNVSFGDTLVAMAGTGTENNGVFTIDAGDGDFWGNSDRGNFIYKPFSGDCEIIAYIKNYYSPEKEWAMAGLMMRDNLTIGSKFAAMMMIAQPGGVLRDRIESEGIVNQSPYPNGLEKAPYWVRLKRVGNLFTGYVSADGLEWKKIREVTIPMEVQIYVGMCATTHDRESNGIYSFEKVTLNAPKKEHSITATSAAGGKISYSGVKSFLEGSDVTYNLTPNTNFAVANLDVDGVSQGKVSSYTFMNLTTSHTINATFEQVSFTVTATAGPNGTITPAGAVNVAKGSSQLFTFTPNSGYKVSNVFVNNVAKGPSDTYTLTNIASDLKINVIFDVIVGIGQEISETALIYPNPAKSNITIELSQIKNGEIEIFSLIGTKVYHDHINDNKKIINTSTLKPGTYFVVVKTETSNLIQKLLILN